jgi:hypothetical protein
MPPSLPASPNLEHLKNQAKSLLKACHANHREARERIARHLPHLLVGSDSDTLQVQLADAQLIIAREYGLPSWAKLKSYVEALPQQTPSVPEGTLSPRKCSIRELAEEVMALTKQGETEKLVYRLVLPLRDMLALRAYIVESGDYETLVDALLPGLEHPHPRVRYECANFVLDHLADARCAEPLRRLIHDPVPRVRRAALHALSCDACKLAPMPARNDFLPVLLDIALNDTSIQVRRHAVYGLGGYCSDARAVTALQTLLARETDEKILHIARRALQRQESLAALTI